MTSSLTIAACARNSSRVSTPIVESFGVLRHPLRVERPVARASFAAYEAGVRWASPAHAGRIDRAGVELECGAHLLEIETADAMKGCNGSAGIDRHPVAPLANLQHPLLVADDDFGGRLAGSRYTVNGTRTCRAGCETDYPARAARRGRCDRRRRHGREAAAGQHRLQAVQGAGCEERKRPVRAEMSGVPMPPSSRVAVPDGGKLAGMRMIVVRMPCCSSTSQNGCPSSQQRDVRSRERQLPAADRERPVRRPRSASSTGYGSSSADRGERNRRCRDRRDPKPVMKLDHATGLWGGWSWRVTRSSEAATREKFGIRPWAINPRRLDSPCRRSPAESPGRPCVAGTAASGRHQQDHCAHKGGQPHVTTSRHCSGLEPNRNIRLPFMRRAAPRTTAGRGAMSSADG